MSYSEKENVLTRITKDDLAKANEFAKAKDTSVLVIFFDDMEDSLLLKQKIGDGEFQKLRKHHDTLLTEIITKDNEGEVVKSTGDGLFAVFYRPSVAVTRALEIQEELSKIREDLPNHPYIKIRIGMDMGEVLNDRTIGSVKDFFGRAVDYSARVTSMAKGGHILVTKSIYIEASNIINKKIARWKEHGSYQKKVSDLPLELYEPYNANITEPMEAPNGLKFCGVSQKKEIEPQDQLPKSGEKELAKSEKSQIRADDYLIGELDAWSDVSLLEKNFILVKQFSEISEHNKWFLCGRRGSGKSAIAIMLDKKRDRWDYCNVIKGERQTYGTYINLVEILETSGLGINIKDFIYLLWRYILRIVIMQTVVQYERERKNNAASIIKSYLEKLDFHTADIGTILLKVFKETKPNARENVEDAYINLHSKCETEEFKLSLSLIPKILEKQNVLIVIDTLESYRIYNNSMREGLKGIIASILDAVKDSNLQNIGIRFFLPAEIYEDISTERPAKIGSSTVFLRWQFSDLLAMLSIRYLDMLKRTNLANGDLISNLDKLVGDALKTSKAKRELREYFWYNNNFLPQSVTNSNDDEEDCFAYILRHTQRRPRELIWILNQIIRKALEKNELPYISEESVKYGLHEMLTMSTLLRDALSPYEEYISEITDRAKSIFTGRPRVMTGIELKHFAKAFYDVAPIKDVNQETFITLLLRSGLIGHIKDEENGADKTSGYCMASFEYLMQDHIAFNNASKYYVHPMMGDFFDMKRVPGYGAVYPLPEDDVWLENEIGCISSATESL